MNIFATLAYFNISVNDILRMAVPNGVNNGSDCVSCLILTIELLLQDTVKQLIRVNTNRQNEYLSPCHYLHYQEVMLFIFKNVIQLHNVRMINLGHDIDFILQSNLVFLIELGSTRNQL